MIAKAHTRFVRVTPQKARRVMREVRGLSAAKALDLLAFAPQKPALPIRKTLVSALANAEQAARGKGVSFDVDQMVIVEAYVDEGPTMKRFRPRAQGRGARILKRTSHLTIVVGTEAEKAEALKPVKQPFKSAAARRAEAAKAEKAAAKKAKAEEKPAAEKKAAEKKAPAKTAAKPAAEKKAAAKTAAKPAAEKKAPAKTAAKKTPAKKTETEEKGAK